MIKVLTGSQMKRLDQQTTEELGIPGILLMENAGRAVYEKVLEIIEDDSKSVLVICGKGNNGGDGFVAARHLTESSVQTTVVSLFRPEDLSDDALINHNILKNFSEIVYFEDITPDVLRDLIAYSDVVVDAVFGTGINTEIKGFQKDIIHIINEYAEGNIVSVDVPSGINADTGEIMGDAVIADYTVTFHSPKLGLLMYPGAENSGEITIAPIGIPSFLTETAEYGIHLITGHYAGICLPFRPDNSHKGSFGRVFSIAGSPDMPGAAFLCAKSALLVGAGYSELAVPESIIPVIAAQAPEIIYTSQNESSVLDKSAESDVVIIGPGLGTEEHTVRLVIQFIQQAANRGNTVIVDGDGLNCLALQENIILPAKSVITPHPRELSRLLKAGIDEIQSNRIGSARQTALELNTIVVLKGANTIIAEPNGNVYINTTGNSGLATAGSGDVLSGMIAGFAAQGVELRDAAILGVYLHGLAANLAVSELNEYSLTAGKLMEYLPAAINATGN